MVKFLIQGNDALNYELMVNACRVNNIDHAVIDYNGGFIENIRNYQDNFNDQFVIYGSIEFRKVCLNCYDRDTDFYELLDFGISKSSCSDYYPIIPKHHLLNSDYVFTTWKEFKRSSLWFFDIFKTNKLFIRPNSGLKTFTGQIIEKYNNETTTTLINDTSSVNENTLIMISTYKPISSTEYRFVIVDKKISTYSPYSWDDIITEHHNIDKVKNFVETVVPTFDYDVAYVMDIAMVNDDPKIIELNSFCCSGLYDCDRYAIVKDIKDALIKLNEYY